MRQAQPEIPVGQRLKPRIEVPGECQRALGHHDTRTSARNHIVSRQLLHQCVRRERRRAAGDLMSHVDVHVADIYP